jgi:glycosyltransferase involved in cell wall biosynthesis
MKVSIITATYNSDSTVRDTLESVAAQTYSNIEHIIVDGLSKDNTLEIVAEYPHVAKVISEKDDGIYDAMNKGILAATGDIIGILNSDDFYPNSGIIQRVVKEFQEKKVDTTIGDILFVSPSNLKKIVRYYSGGKWKPSKFVRGYMPPHPSFFVYKKFYDELGLYQIDYKIAADYELLIRFLATNKLSYSYIPEAIVYMREGGVSNASIKSRYVLNREIVRACKENGLDTNMLKLCLKYFSKIFEYFPKYNINA